jgi:hypothetical protein
VSARGRLLRLLGDPDACFCGDPCPDAAAVLDAYDVERRAEVLREAADLIDNDDECWCGGCDTCLARDFATRIRNLNKPTA